MKFHRNKLETITQHKQHALTCRLLMSCHSATTIVALEWMKWIGKWYLRFEYKFGALKWDFKEKKMKKNEKKWKKMKKNEKNGKMNRRRRNSVYKYRQMPQMMKCRNGGKVVRIQPGMNNNVYIYR